MKMVRKQVYITPEQDRELKLLAKQLGLSEAELIRRGITLLEEECGSEEAQKHAAWQRVLQMMEDRARVLPEGGSTEQFVREEVYAERLERLGRILG